jgi:hypothetical protein
MGQFTIRAFFDSRIIRVYQAFNPEIARAALEKGRFAPPFSMDRMTWIKPSFNWMMYRSAYATKPGQEMVLAIDITREGFEWALENAVLSTFSRLTYSTTDKWRRMLGANPVRVQWDPERDWNLHKVEGVRSIQVGLSGEAVVHYVNDWTVRIEDFTPVARDMSNALSIGRTPANRPDQRERVYSLRESLARKIIPQ